MNESYFGCFLPQPVWVGNSLDLNTLAEIKLASKQVGAIAFSANCRHFKIKVTRDGLFYFHIPSLLGDGMPNPNFGEDGMIKRWNAHLDFANCFYLLLAHSVLQHHAYDYFSFQEIDVTDVCTATFEEDRLISTGYGGITQTSLRSNFSRRSVLATACSNLDEILKGVAGLEEVAEAYVSIMETMVSETSPRFHNFVLPLHLLQETATLLDDVRDRDPMAVHLIAELGKALSQYKVGDYDVALALAWFVVEKIITAEWDDYLTSKNLDTETGKRINSERRRALSDHNFTVSVKLNALELNDVLPTDVFKKLDKVRQHRNAVVHKSDKYTCSRVDAFEAIEAANLMISRRFLINIKLSGSISYMGLYKSIE